MRAATVQALAGRGRAQLLLAGAPCSGAPRQRARHRRAALQRRTTSRGSRPRSSTPFVAALPGRRDAEPLRRLQSRPSGGGSSSWPTSLGAAWVATGHYARVVWRDGEPLVARGRDRAKDQSYMLWRVPPGDAGAPCVPARRADQARGTRAARRARRAAPGRPSPRARRSASPPSGYREFLAARGVAAARGDDRRRRRRACSGTHEGQWRFTVGQRRGLGV